MSELKNYTLSELLSSVRRCLEVSFGGSYWIQAETSDVRRTPSSGHCYLELLEKSDSGSILARVRANIWTGRYQSILRKFTEAGLEAPTSGVKILALVRITFHEQFGLSLDIQDIDVNYSLGEIARLRQQTIQRLKSEGLWGLNKELTLGRPLQRIAIISSSGAAGYGDFIKHIHTNRFALVCYTALFPAQMQGERVTESVMNALERILDYQELFDAVVIIRGGGAVSELRAFDMYTLCAACAQYPLPIITGIGHERDECVLDLVAHTSHKTPTAVADFIINSLHRDLEQIDRLGLRLTSATSWQSVERDRWLRGILGQIPLLISSRIAREQQVQGDLRLSLERQVRHYLSVREHRLEQRSRLLPYYCQGLIQSSRGRLDTISEKIKSSIAISQQKHRMELHAYEQLIKLSHPKQILKRGFAVIKKQGQVVKSSTSLAQGDELTISLEHAEMKVEVLNLFNT
ncbi:MAG: exodeoxyribonuclease VII large subunit [Porphyromonadaceae bacterium]|nr:exodeoxyribonuclease VII large subunit [Porphyromonadaceae bacterium]